MDKYDFKFTAKNKPNEELVEEFHKSLAKSLLNKYGEDFIIETLKVIEEKDK